MYYENFMYRDATSDIHEWSRKQDRKPLLLRGAPRTGKTSLLRHFGMEVFPSMAYISFELDIYMRDVVQSTLDTDIILNHLEWYLLKDVTPRNTFIIFDDLHAVENGPALLKAFAQKAPDYVVAATGSWPHIAPHLPEMEGYVEVMNVYPMTFSEFLRACDHNYLEDIPFREKMGYMDHYHDNLVMLLRQYLCVGGMPEAVYTWIKTKDPNAVREEQYQILKDYWAELALHLPATQVNKYRSVWSSIGWQLAQKNKKFTYSRLHPGARAKEYEPMVHYLCQNGWAMPAHRISTPTLPLQAQADTQNFKLFMVDVGLLGARYDITPRMIGHDYYIFEVNESALVAQYVMQELTALQPDYIGYWTNERSTSHVDFILQIDNQVIPIAILPKRELQTRHYTAFLNQYHPTPYITTSLAPYLHGDQSTYIPLYALTLHIRNLTIFKGLLAPDTAPHTLPEAPQSLQ